MLMYCAKTEYYCVYTGCFGPIKNSTLNIIAC